MDSMTASLAIAEQKKHREPERVSVLSLFFKKGRVGMSAGMTRRIGPDGGSAPGCN